VHGPEASVLLPASYDIAWSAALIAVLAVTAIALMQVLRPRLLSASARTLWLLAVLFLPILGAIAWFVNRPRPSAQPRD
jgi:hypothetical protein